MSAKITDRFREHLHSYDRMSYVDIHPNDERSKPENPSYDTIDCSLGTNPYGCSPHVLEMLKSKDWSEIHRYPDPTYRDLSEALIRFWNDVVPIEREQILIGAGTSGLLEKILKASIESGRSVLGYTPQFTEFITEVLSQGGTYCSVPLRRSNHFKFDPDAFLAALNAEFTLVYIDNPNNPTGQIIPLNLIRKILQKSKLLNLPVIVDEAYGDFTAKEYSSLSLIPEYDNLITVRSFSKGSGLANFRIGYAVCQKPLMSMIKKVDLPFPVSTCAALAATVSLSDENFVIESRRKIALAKEKLMQALPNLYFATTDYEIPILIAGVEDTDTHLGQLLQRKGILTESGSDFYNLGQNYVRIRIPADTDRLIERLREI